MRKRILLIDHNELIRSVMKEELKNKGLKFAARPVMAHMESNKALR